MWYFLIITIIIHVYFLFVNRYNYYKIRYSFHDNFGNTLNVFKFLKYEKEVINIKEKRKYYERFIERYFDRMSSSSYSIREHMHERGINNMKIYEYQFIYALGLSPINANYYSIIDSHQNLRYAIQYLGGKRFIDKLKEIEENFQIFMNSHGIEYREKANIKIILVSSKGNAE